MVSKKTPSFGEVNAYRKEASNYFDSKGLIESLFLLDDKKLETIELQEQYGELPEKIVITINGTPRAGKTTCVNNLFEFFKKSNLRTASLVEPAGLVYQTLKSKEEKIELLKDRVGFVDRQYQIGFDDIQRNLEDHDIILCDRGILDTFVWYRMYYGMGMVDKERYIEFLKRLNEKLNYQSRLYSLYVGPDISLYRDYRSSISIEPRTTMNRTNIERYNAALGDIAPKILCQHVDKFEFIDTDGCDILDPSIQIANEVLDEVKRLYLKGCDNDVSKKQVS